MRNRKDCLDVLTPDIPYCVTGANFPAWTPTVEHAEHNPDIDFDNDDAFVRDIEGFDAMDKYVMRWRGHFNAEQQGYYAFSTTSDDGSMLYIDGEVVVDNDGLHGPQRREGIVTLSPGQHSIVITFFENDGGAKMQATVTPPNGRERVLGGDMLSNPFGCGDDQGVTVGANERCAIDFCEDTMDCPQCAAGLSCAAVSAATVGLGCDCCRDSDARPLLRTAVRPGLRRYLLRHLRRPRRPRLLHVLRARLGHRRRPGLRRVRRPDRGRLVVLPERDRARRRGRDVHVRRRAALHGGRAL